MTNKDKILRYLECGLKVKAVEVNDESDDNECLCTCDCGYSCDCEYVCYCGNNNEHNDDYWTIHGIEGGMFVASSYSGYAKRIGFDDFEDHTITPITLKPNYQPGDFVRILPIAREFDRFDRWDKDAKNMVDSGFYEIKKQYSGDYSVYTKNRSYDYYFPSWALAPAFPDEIEQYKKDKQDKKRKELEAKIVEIQKELDALKN